MSSLEKAIFSGGIILCVLMLTLLSLQIYPGCPIAKETPIGTVEYVRYDHNGTQISTDKLEFYIGTRPALSRGDQVAEGTLADHWWCSSTRYYCIRDRCYRQYE